MNTECFRVLPGQDLAETIERYCAERQIQAAAVLVSLRRLLEPRPVPDG